MSNPLAGKKIKERQTNPGIIKGKNRFCLKICGTDPEMYTNLIRSLIWDFIYKSY